MRRTIDQWPLPGGASIDLLRMPSLSGATVDRPARVPGAALRELVVRGVVVPSYLGATAPKSERLAATVVLPTMPLPFGPRSVAARLALVAPGPLRSMVRAAQSDDIARRAAGLAPKRTRLREVVTWNFGRAQPIDGTPIPTAHDETLSLEGRGLAIWRTRRTLLVITMTEQARTAAGDDWARQAAEIMARLSDLDRLVRTDPLEAATLVQRAGALVAVVPVSMTALARLAHVVAVDDRPTASGHDHAFDVIGGTEAALRACVPDLAARLADPEGVIPDVLSLVSAAYVAAAPTTT